MSTGAWIIAGLVAVVVAANVLQWIKEWRWKRSIERRIRQRPWRNE